MSIPDSNDRPQDPTARSGVTFFLVAAFGISWGAYLIRQSADWGVAVDQTLRMIVKFGPSLAGLLAAFHVYRMAGVRDILRRLVAFRVHAGWYLLALLLPIFVLLLALPLRILLDGEVWTTRRVDFSEALALYASLLATRLFAGGGLGEELGWRGFMLPQLQSRTGAFKASLLIGVAHGAWHLPAFKVGAVLMTVFTIAGAIVMTWMYNRTNGNLLLPALMHASGNASLPVFESLFPGLDNELVFPLLVFGLWALLAVLLVWKVGKDGLEKPARETVSTPGR